MFARAARHQMFGVCTALDSDCRQLCIHQEMVAAVTRSRLSSNHTIAGLQGLTQLGYCCFLPHVLLMQATASSTWPLSASFNPVLRDWSRIYDDGQRRGREAHFLGPVHTDSGLHTSHFIISHCWFANMGPVPYHKKCWMGRCGDDGNAGQSLSIHWYIKRSSWL
jgi:hypothetical protein